jgi:serine/threonine-protein kinase
MVGQNIGKYRVEDRLGRGGMGTVYRAVDETLHREVAIKVLNAELNDPEVARRFRAEAITVARLSHPGIATIYELFQHDGQWLMVMEFVRGETLERLVERMGSLSPQRAAELCMQSLAALAHAHSMGVVHRDLKPANLMITENGSVKIMDFGIARVAGTEHLTNAGYMMGTPAYMAPEQVRGHEIDARADLYAMGVVFYRLTTGRLPFKGETPFAMAQSQVNDQPTPIGLFRTDLPAWVEQILSRALAKAPELRFQSAVEFHEALARCLAGLSMATTGAASSGAASSEVLTTPVRLSGTGTISSRFQTAAPDAPTGYATPVGLSASGDPTRAVTPQPSPQVTSPRKLAMPVALGVAALVLALAGIGGVLYFRWQTQAPPAPDTTSTTPGSPESSAVPPAAVPPTDAASAAATTTGAPAAQPPAAPGTDVSASRTAQPPVSPGTGRGTEAAGRGAANAARSQAPPTPDPAVMPPPAGAAPPPPDPRTPSDPSDSQVVFPDVKVLVITGRKAQDRDALLSFVGGQVTVLNRQGGSILATTSYKAIERATYVRARNPKWDPALFSPPPDLDMPGILPTARHWLVLQGKSAYLILQLDGNTWPKVLETVEARTGIKVDRAK